MDRALGGLPSPCMSECRIVGLLACAAFLLCGEAQRIAVLPITVSEATAADAQAAMAKLMGANW